MEKKFIINQTTLYADNCSKAKIMHASQTQNGKYKARQYGKLERKYLKNKIGGKWDKRRSVICVIESTGTALTSK